MDIGGAATEKAAPKRRKSKADQKADLVSQAAMLSGAVFSGLAMLRGPHWSLQKTEKLSIGQAIADCLDALPDAQTEAATQVMSKFAAPFALASALAAAVVPRVMFEQQHMATQLKAEAARKAPPKQSEAPNVSNNPVTATAPTNPQTSRVVIPDSQLYSPAADGRASNPEFLT